MAPPVIGYARTSTLDQHAGLEQQVRELEAMGCYRVFAEQASSVRERPQFEEALRYLRQGDTFVVTRLDRLGRSARDMLNLVEHLKARGVAIRVLNPSIAIGANEEGGMSKAMAEMFLTLLSAVAQFEREIMLERQAVGIAKAKAEGKYVGRQPTARRQSAEVMRVKGEGLGATAIAKRLGIHRASVYRILKEAVRRGGAA